MGALGSVDKKQLGEHLSTALERAVKVMDVEQIFGGASRQTFTLSLAYEDGESADAVLRMPQKNGLIDTDQEVEFQAYRAFEASDVPVPRVLLKESSGDVLGAPFLLMERAPGAAGNPFQRNFYAGQESEVGEQFWTILGRIASTDPQQNGLTEYFEHPEPQDCWRRELDHWESVLRSKSMATQPIVEAAIRYLRQHPPAPAQCVSMVHGDYRMGNFLVDGDRVSAILDWELAHLGDPLEDLGWAMSRLWNRFDPEKPGALVATDEALTIWSNASGIEVDPDALHWWRLFNCVKGMAIWNSAGHSFSTRANTFPGYLNGAWLAGDIHLDEIVTLMGRA